MKLVARHFEGRKIGFGNKLQEKKGGKRAGDKAGRYILAQRANIRTQ